MKRTKLKHTLLFLIFLAGAVTTGAQTPLLTYYLHANEAKYRHYCNDNKRALAAMDAAFAMEPEIDPPFIDEYFYALFCAKARRKKDAVLHLNRCFQKQVLPIYDIWDYRPDSSIIVKDPFFSFINEDESLRLPIERRVKALLDSFRHSLARTLLDSAKYYWVNGTWYYSEQNHNVIAKLTKYHRYIDSSLGNHDALERKVVALVERCGTLNIHNSGSEKFFTSLLHLSKERKDRIKPILEREWQEGKMSPCEWGFFLERRIMDDFDSSDCWGYYVLNYHCKEDQWPTIIENRKRIGMSIYLNQDDYVQNPDLNRTKLPWVGKLVD